MSFPSKQISVGFMPLETRREVTTFTANKANDLGYTAFGLPETGSYDTMLLLTEVALKTQQIKLMAGVLGIWGRSAAQIAMAATTLNIISGDRFILGLGSSTKQLAEGFHDTHFQAPYEKLRLSINQIRACLNGERIPLSEENHAYPLRLGLPTQPELPILLGASASRSIGIAGELCDGWIPFLCPKERLHKGITQLQQGAEKQGKDPNLLHVCPSIPTIVNDNPEIARADAAWSVAFYLMIMGPIYRNALKRLGYENEVNAIVKANQGQKPKIVPPETDSLLKQLTIYGTPAQAKDQLSKWYQVGTTMPGIILAPNMTIDEIEFLLEALCPQI